MSATIMPSALRCHVRNLPSVLLREVERETEESIIVEVLPEKRNAQVSRYLATNEAPRLRLVRLKRRHVYWYFQPLTNKESHG